MTVSKRSTVRDRSAIGRVVVDQEQSRRKVVTNSDENKDNVQPLGYEFRRSSGQTDGIDIGEVPVHVSPVTW